MPTAKLPICSIAYTMLKQFALKYFPDFLLEWAKQRKKNQRRTQLKQQKENKSGISKQRLIEDFFDTPNADTLNLIPIFILFLLSLSLSLLRF